MWDGWIKAAAASPEIRVADCQYNAAQIQKTMQQAGERGAQLLVLPELCLTGYTCQDLFLQQSLIDQAKRALSELAAFSHACSVLTIVGLPMQWEGKVYNCAAVVYRGKLLGVVPKTHLPNYGEFYERRHFMPTPQQNGRLAWEGGAVPFGQKLVFCCEELPSFTLGVEICEDLWVPAPPSIRHAMAGATVIANLSASDEVIGKDAFRRQLVAAQSAKLIAGYVYADAGEGESTTDLVFAGHHLIAENGAVLAESPPFDDAMAVAEIDVQRLEKERQRMTTYPACQREGYEVVPFSMPMAHAEISRPISPHPFVPDGAADRAARCRYILNIQAHGLKKRLAHTGAKTAVVGISGGLDSCLALLAAAHAMDLLGRPRTDILAVTMPCFGTTLRTRSNAEALCSALGVTFRTVEIARTVRSHFEDIGHEESVRNAVYENAQARERTQVLMDLANQTEGLVIGTGDLSELALGWATYNGDQMSMYGVNAAIPKTLVRYLVQYEAEHAESMALRKVLQDIYETPVSPELLPADKGEIAQKTEDLVGPYELHDFFLYYMMRWGFSPKKIFRMAAKAFETQYAPQTILHWERCFYRRFFAQQFKRSAMPDGPKVGTVSLSPRGDWRMPSDASAAGWLCQLDDLAREGMPCNQTDAVR